MKTLFKLGIIVGIALFLSISACEHKPKDIIKPGSTDTTKPIVKPVSNCSPDTAYFKNTILPMLISNCNGVGCHNETDRAEGIVLTSYAGVKKITSAGKPNSSKLYVYIISNSKPMPPYPYQRLSQANIDLVKKWIEQGALNNGCNDGCDSTKFAYAADISKIISANCLGCHNIGTTKLGTYSDLKVVVDNSKLWGALNHLAGYQPMPTASTKIDDCQMKQIQKWIAAGAPNN